MGLFRERAPLSDRPSLFYSVFAADFFSGDHALDTLLLGQGVPARLGPPRLSAEEWRRRVQLRQKIVERSLGQAEALPLLRDRHPELLARFVESGASWVHRWLANSVRHSGPDAFVELCEVDDIRARLVENARQFHNQVRDLCVDCGGTLPDWWMSGWSNAADIITAKTVWPLPCRGR